MTTTKTHQLTLSPGDQQVCTCGWPSGHEHADEAQSRFLAHVAAQPCNDCKEQATTSRPVGVHPRPGAARVPLCDYCAQHWDHDVRSERGERDEEWSA